jgi:DNA (cytosine-5)-methyltransferase 1
MDVEQRPLRELALFAGGGGGILGGRLLGWRTICAVELDPYAASILVARQNDGTLAPFPVWDDVCTFDGKPWRGRVDVVSGGFPCQDTSAANPKGAGINGARSGLWREMARIIREVEPLFVFVENSPRLVSKGLGQVLGDLAKMGFDAEWGVLGARHAGAPHRRDRMWVVASNPARYRRRERRARSQDKQEPGQAVLCCGALTDIVRAGLPLAEREALCGTERRDEGRAASECSWWSAEPDVVRMVHGVSARVDRIKVLGNAQVPAVAALAWRILFERLMNGSDQ